MSHTLFHSLNLIFFFSVVSNLPCWMVNAYSRNCTISDSVGKELIRLQVKIRCTTDDEQMLECINSDAQNIGPALQVDPAFCGPLNVTIRFKVCNDGPEDFEVNDRRSRILYNAQELNLPIGGSGGKNIEVGRCRTLMIKRTFDTCERQGRAMSIRVQGKSDVDNRPVFGYCYLHRRATVDYIQKISGPCASSNFMFTEVAFPNDHPIDGKYVEIYNPDCAGGAISEDYKIVKYSGDLNNAITMLSLKNLPVRNDGFILLCSEPMGKAYMTNDLCDIINADVGPTMPHDAFSITASDGTVIDVYGYPSDNEDHAPVQRAVRKRIGSSASSRWKSNDWLTKGLAMTWDMDPRRWNYVS